MVDAMVEKTGAEEIVWNLSIFYQGVDDPAIQRDIDGLLTKADEWAARYRGQVGALSAAEMNRAMRDYEAIYDGFGRIEAFVYLTYTTDTNNPPYGALLQKLTEVDAQMAQKLVFFELEWLTLEDDAATKVLDDPALGRYRHYLEAARRYKPYKLSEIEEQLLVEKDVTGRAAWGRLFQQIIASTRYDFDGERLTISQVLAKLQGADREARRKAADAITKTLREKSMETTFILNVMVADKASEDRRRGYPGWLWSRNLANKASDEVVDALVQAVTSQYDLVARHYGLKRQILGYDTLYDYDRYAPLPVADAERTYRWPEARAIVQKAYDAFSPRVGAIVRRFFDENWIHAALLPNKRSGAFASATVPSAHPFILVNFTGKSGDVKTLAHELGHGVHMVLAQEKQGLIGSHTPLTTAEMASVFGEMTVFDDLMKNEPDAAARLGMLANKIEDTFATVFRQTAMNRFEDRVHNARREQGELSSEQISQAWMETQRAMFGDSVTLRDDYNIWWSYINHFYSVPGYVYAYAFGELLVLALFNLYRERGAAFVPQYLDVLAAGDSDYPERILGKVGVELTDPGFWNEGLNTIRRMIEQEEALAREVFPDQVT